MEHSLANITSSKGRIALQVLRKIALCDRAFSFHYTILIANNAKVLHSDLKFTKFVLIKANKLQRRQNQPQPTTRLRSENVRKKNTKGLSPKTTRNDCFRMNVRKIQKAREGAKN